MGRFGEGRGRWARDAIGFTPGDDAGEGGGPPPDDGWEQPGEPEPGWSEPPPGESGPVEAFPGEGDPPPDPLDEEPEPEPEPPIVIEVFVYEWVTQADGRVCPVCGPLDGTRWEDDDGPFPPLHVGCRCARRLVAVERRTARE